MHNRALHLMGLEGHYIPILVDDLTGSMAAIRALKIRGVSVTIPFKEAVMPLLDEIDADARHIGSVNTILNDGKKLKGFNTDWKGVEAALAKKMRIAGKTFVLVGAGGTTRSAIYAVKKNGGTAIIVSRNPEKGKALAAEFDCEWMPFADISQIKGDCLINTTPLGMTPRIEAMPVPEHVIPQFKYVMDVVYNPPETRLLRTAKMSRAVTISGVEMFVAQGGEQLRIWTGREPPCRSMRAVVIWALRKKNH